MSTHPRFKAYASRELASRAAAEFAARKLDEALGDKALASLLVSGGSTPAEMFERLAHTPLDWAHVVVGLVDERWVGPEHPASNERLVRASLLTHHAGAAGFIPMKTQHLTAAEAVADRARAYAPHCAPADVVLIGMGSDAHTASWFPGAHGLEDALSLHAEHAVAAIRADDSPVAGAHVERMTLTAPVICGARAAILLIFGADKRETFDAALTRHVNVAPVRRAVDALGDRLQVIWAP